MDYLKKIRQIITLLQTHGYTREANAIIDLRDGGNTSSELLMSVTHKLLGLIDTNTTLRDLIGNDVKQLKEFCWSIGLQVL